MKKLLLKGTRGALLEVCNSSTKYEIVSAWCYDDKTESWGQGHYFTLWYDDITEDVERCTIFGGSFRCLSIPAVRLFYPKSKSRFCSMS